MTCEKCGHPMPTDVLPGVPKMGPIKKRIFQAVSKATPYGIPLPDLFDKIYRDDPDGGPLDTHGIAVHIAQMNRKWLRPRGLEIRSALGRGNSSYTLRRIDHVR